MDTDIASHQKKVLVVDDIPSARKIVQRILNRLGFSEVAQACSLSEASELVECSTLELIIADVHLKDGLAFELLETLESNSCHTPILFISSDMDVSLYHNARKNGQRIDYLLKPFSTEMLAEKIHSLSR